MVTLEHITSGHEPSILDLEITSQISDVMELQFLSTLGKNDQLTVNITALASTQGCPEMDKELQ